MEDVRGFVAFVMLVGLGAWSSVRVTRAFDLVFRRLEDIEVSRRGACFPARRSPPPGSARAGAAAEHDDTGR
jgi:hypothetical protein